MLWLELGKGSPVWEELLVGEVGVGRLSPSAHVLGGPLGREQLRTVQKWAPGFKTV